MNPIDNYILNFPLDVQELLKQIRNIIKAAAPLAEETINYQMPTFKLHGNLVHFAGYKNHIGFYPAPSAIIKFQKEISSYVNSKGAVQFPLDQPLPEKLITRMVQFRVKENTEKALAKTKKQKTNLCKNGHTFIKSSDCPVCPQCEKEKKNRNTQLSFLSAPAYRALINEGIDDLKQLSGQSENRLLGLHGIGQKAIDIIKTQLKKNNLAPLKK